MVSAPFGPPPCSQTAQPDDASDGASLKMPGLVSSSCSRTGTATPPLVEAQADEARADEDADEKADEAQADESPVERRVSARCGSAAVGWRALQQRSEHHLGVHRCRRRCPALKMKFGMAAARIVADCDSGATSG